MGGSRVGHMGVLNPPLLPGKPYVAIGFLRNTGKDQPREAMLAPFGPSVSSWRFVRPSMKYVNDEKCCQDLSPHKPYIVGCAGPAHVTCYRKF